MAADGSTTEFNTWASAGHAIRIHYRTELMDSISEAAWEGLQKVPRRGLEIGGVLYGERDGDEVRILEWRPIACEHSSGPSFELSDRDKEGLRQQLHDTEAAPQGLAPVGWFHTHTKDGVFLSESDIALYNSYFPARWQVALVLRPHLYDPPRAGFFFREEDGSMQAERSYVEFELARRSRRLPIGFDPSNPQVRSPLRDGSPEAITPSAPIAAPPSPEPRTRRASEPSPATGFELPDAAPPQKENQRRWAAWLITAVPVVAILVLLVAPLVDRPDSDAVRLQARDTGGQLVLEWNRAATPVMAAETGLLRILDGPNEREYELSREELRTGNVTYLRESGDVEFRLELMVSGIGTHSEITRFLGEAPVAGTTSAEDSSQRMLLETEAELLQRQLAEEADRNRELRDTIDRMRETVVAR